MPSNNVNVVLKLSMYNVCKNHYPIFIIMHIFSYAIQTLGLFNCFVFISTYFFSFYMALCCLLLYHCLAPGNNCILIVFQFLLLKNTINISTVKVLCLLLPSSIFVALVDCIT